MYKLTVYNLKRKMISEDVVMEYPSDDFVQSRLNGLSDVFVDICRVEDTGTHDAIGFDDELLYELEELNELVK